MNTKHLILTLLLVFIFISCKSDKKTETPQETTIKENVATPDRQEETNTYKPIQKLNAVNNSSNYTKHLLVDTENYYTVSEDKIHVEIPISDKEVEIIDVFNVSDYNQNGHNYNAIVLHLTNNKSTRTGNKVTHKIISDLKISKIKGLDKKMLSDKNHELKVYIINEDILDSDEKKAFIECVKDEADYTSHKECDLDKSILYESNPKENKEDFIRPREQEGDIIIGG